MASALIAQAEKAGKETSFRFNGEAFTVTRAAQVNVNKLVAFAQPSQSAIAWPASRLNFTAPQPITKQSSMSTVTGRQRPIASSSGKSYTSQTYKRSSYLQAIEQNLQGVLRGPFVAQKCYTLTKNPSQQIAFRATGLRCAQTQKSPRPQRTETPVPPQLSKSSAYPPHKAHQSTSQTAWLR